MAKKSEKEEVVEAPKIDIKKKVDAMVVAIDNQTISNDDDMAKAGVMKVNVKKLQKYILQEKKKQLDPANETVKAIKAFWAPFEEKVQMGLNAIDRGMIVYHDVQEQIRKKEEARIEKMHEAGRMKEETAVNKLADLGEEKKTMHTGEGSVTFTKIKKVRVTDESKVPDAYWVLDMVKVRADALSISKLGGDQLGEMFPGVEVYEETNTSTRT